MRITIEMIPYGFDNRITKESLIRVTGLSDRTVRDQLSELAIKYPICASSRWTGVFRPLPSEKMYVEICKAETRNRGRNVFSRMRAYDEYLKSDIQPSLGL